MKPRTRKLTLAVFISLFLIAGPLTVLYAYGWRWDFKNFRPVRIGGIFLRHLPSDAVVLLNNAPIRNRIQSFLTGNLINNLPPGNYSVSVQKPGFRPWRKNFSVTPSEVSESKPIILLPEKLAETKVLTGRLRDFWINGSKLIYRTAAGEFFLTDIDAPASRIPLDTKRLKLEMTDSAPAAKTPLPQGLALPDLRLIESISPYSDPDHEFVQYPGAVYLLELDDRAPLNLQPIATGVLKHAYDHGRLYLLRPTGLSYIEI